MATPIAATPHLNMVAAAAAVLGCSGCTSTSRVSPCNQSVQKGPNESFNIRGTHHGAHHPAPFAKYTNVSNDAVSIGDTCTGAQCLKTT